MDFFDVDIRINNFTYRRRDQIKNDSDTLIFKGSFNGTTPIALKRQMMDQFSTKSTMRELEYLFLPAIRHRNLIRYFGQATDENFQ